MNRPRSLLCLSLLLLPLAVGGCDQPVSSTRSLSGHVSIASYQKQGRALDNPVLIARSSDHRSFLAHVAPSGAWTLTLPTGVGYRLTLANSTATVGRYHALSRVHWNTRSGRALWARFSDGKPVSLGIIHPISVPLPAASPAAVGLQAASDGKDGKDEVEKDDDGEHDEVEGCDAGDEDDGEVEVEKADDDGGKDLDDDDDKDKDDGDKACGNPDGGGMKPQGNPQPQGGPCQTTLDCQGGLTCFQNKCIPPIL